MVVVGDATRVRQILINLLGNAIKFADRGEVSLTVSQHGDALRFTVREGAWHRAGTAEAIVPALRTRRGCAHQFARRRQRAWAGDLPGTHRGDERPNPRGQPAWRRHPVHRGSALPIDRSGTHIAAGQVQLLAGEPLRILLVEDDPAVAEVISGLSTNRGHRVVHAVHGLAALSETVDGRFDIALLDLDLPGRDGFALALQLRQLGHRFALPAVTAQADSPAQTQTKAAGFDGFPRKPVTADLLVEAITAACDVVSSCAAVADGTASADLK
ncbi:hypothetical protein IB69_007520 [Xanthomonas citri]|nr:hypothetical protein IB69_007520 [Xanthomonas citri]